MRRLWAPWRAKFVTHPQPKGCIFCRKPVSGQEDKNLILERGKKVYSLLNLYPYNNGHVMIAPYRHLRYVTLLSRAESGELFDMMRRTLKRLDRVLKPQGYNVGFNIGKVAGAGFHNHVHLHIVPRWLGDTNFMPVIADTKVIPQSLLELRKKLLGRK